MDKKEFEKLKKEVYASIESGKDIDKIDKKRFRQFMFSDEYLDVDGQKFQKPRCHSCGKAMKPRADKKTGKVAGYEWICDCPGYPDNMVLSVG